MRNPSDQMRRNLERLSRETIQDARKRLVALAADSRKAIQRSLKSGGKNRYSKTYRTSKPGEPPLTHGARLKRSIRYQIESPDKIIVGAPSLSGSKTAKTLEHGGVGKITETTLSASYFNRRKARAKTIATSRPTAKRPYTLRSETGKSRRVKEYERFTSESSAKRGISSPGFQAWRSSVQKTTTTALEVKPRPFVAPAVRVQISLKKR